MAKQARKYTKEELEIMGNQRAHKFAEWHEVFEFLSVCRKNGMSELESWSILSNRFDINFKGGEIDGK